MKIIVNNTYSKIENTNDIELIKSLHECLSYYVEGYMFTKAYRQGWFKNGEFIHWDGKKHLLSRKLEFPTGLLETVCEFLTNHNQSYEVEDRRKIPKQNERIPIKGFIPRQYQKEAVETFIEKGRGVLRIGTGGGKSLIAAMIAGYYNVPTVIYVIGKDLLYQFYETFTKIFNENIVGMIGDGICDPKRITICSVWSATTAFNKKADSEDNEWDPEVNFNDDVSKAQIKKTISSAQLSIFDEAHYLGTETLQTIYKASKNCYYFCGLSGTDWRTDGADLLLEAVCGKRIFNLTSSELIKQGFLVQPKILMIEVPDCGKVKKHYPTVYSKCLVEHEARNKLICSAAQRLYEQGRKVLILVRQIKHGKSLKSMLPGAEFVSGQLAGSDRIELRDAFLGGEVKFLISTSIYDTGVDIPELDGLILAGGGKSSVKALQRIGRVVRTGKGKQDALVVDFIDKAPYLNKHSLVRYSVYRTEPLFKIKLKGNLSDKKSNKILKDLQKIIKNH